MRRNVLRVAGMVVALVAAAAAPPPPARTLDQVKARHLLLCGITVGLPGFAMPDSRGVPQGLDADTCRAIAAAVLGDATRLKFVLVNDQNRFIALQSGAVDVLLGETTWTLSREARAGLLFAGVNFYDGAGFLVKKSLGVTAATQLDGATICVPPGTSSELAVADYFRLHAMTYRAVEIANQQQIRAAFLTGRCDVFATDRTNLAGLRFEQAGTVELVLLPEIISKEPLGPMVRKGDDRWFDIVRWTLLAAVTAEELGISSRTIDSATDSRNPAIRRLIGLEGDLGAALGLDRRFAYNAVRQVGNYGEMWNAAMAPLGLARGRNELWTSGGLLYAPPMR